MFLHFTFSPPHDKPEKASQTRAIFLPMFLLLALLMPFCLAAQTTLNFIYTGNSQTFTVPAGVTSLHIVAYGARGSKGTWGLTPRAGGKVEADLSVTPGQTLTIVVGGAGATVIGGYNGGGGINQSSGGAGGGGGATDIRIGGTTLANRVLVAGGSGGSGDTQGGAGGDIVAGAGDNYASNAQGGGGGSSATGGTGGFGIGISGNNGALGQGGTGYYYAGGGGGGYYGGGGGGENFDGYGGSGGGGSSYTDPTLCSNVVHTQAGNPNNEGSLILTFYPCTPPTAYNVTGSSGCSSGGGVAVGLDNSESGVEYQLQNDGNNVGIAVSGTGSAIHFGNQTAGGTYTVVATKTSNGCTAEMSGSVTISPKTYAITGGGTYCSGGSGVAVGLENSQSGVEYQLQIDGINGGMAVAGTGLGLDFGNQTAAGTYTVVATNTSNGCTAVMMGSATVIINTPELPVLATVTPICVGGTATLSATTSVGSIDWYDAATGGNLLGNSASGENFEQSPTMTTTYYAQITPPAPTQTFNYIGDTQTFTVPAGVTSLHVVAQGASGSQGGTGQMSSAGGKVEADLSVTPGQTLTIVVGGTGSNSVGGYNGGAGTMVYSSSGGGGGGGGATDIRIGGTALTDRILVAGGSGGSGNSQGGAGGGLVGDAGDNFGSNAMGGGGGSATTGGSGGFGNVFSGLNGALGEGGAGALRVGGGGGGGYYGGGGGGQTSGGIPNYGGGGGGGSSYTDPTLCSNVIHTQAGATGNEGLLVFTWTSPSFCISTDRVAVPVTVEVPPTTHAVTGGGSFCSEGSGVAVGLANSESGVDYQLQNDGSNVGFTVSGTGSAIDFGNQTTGGTYTVVATKTSNGCTAAMTGSAVLSPSPIIYAVTGGGAFCTGGGGVVVGLGNSQIGVVYQLQNDNNNVGSAVSGTGSVIDFGNQTAEGTYSIMATNSADGCTATMTGSALVTITTPELPVVAAVSPICAGGMANLSATTSVSSVDWYDAATGGNLLGNSASGANFPRTPEATTTYYAQIKQPTIAVSQTYNFTGNTQTFTVPTGVTSVHVVAQGARGFRGQGGNGFISNAGGKVEADLSVTPGQTLTVTVGGTGNICVGGYNGGGGANGYYFYGGGGGGGATDIRMSGTSLTDRVLVAGGSGGGGENGLGGAGGGLVAGAGSSYYSIPGGGGGSATEGGLGGVPSANGTLGQGGTSSSLSGGGGGGGYYGGGGSGGQPDGSGASGGGGSSYTDPLLCSNVVHTQAGASGNNGSLVFTWLLPDPNACVSTDRVAVPVTVYATPATFAVTGGGSFCSGGAGVAVGLDNSESGMEYQLQNNGSNIGSAVSGTGSAIDFGNQTAAGTYTVLATNTSGGCTAVMTGIATVTVNESLTPDVTITSDDMDNTTTQGTSVTFTATPINGGTMPAYQWKVNGINVGTDSDTYTDASLEDGDVVTCEMTSNDPCAWWPPIVTSNEITMTVTTLCPSGGEIWTAHSAAEANGWLSVTYGNGLFVAVAYSGTNRVMTSSDGINWTARTAAENNYWYSITYGNGLFVAVALDGTNQVMTSPDAINWTARSAAEANLWRSVTYGNGLFVAVSNNGTNRVMTSPDGITWTGHAPAVPESDWANVTYGNGLFVAVASGGYDRVMTSPDGINWTARSVPENNDWPSVTYGNGLFVAVSGNGTNHVMISLDGITWTAQAAAEPNNWRSVTYSNGLFVAVAANGTNRVMTSPDGINWTSQSAAEENQWLSVTNGNGKFVAVAHEGVNRVMTSSAGILPYVSIASDDADNSITPGTSVTFTATPINGGTMPAYQWKVNGINVGIDSATYTSSALTDGDVVTCEMTSNDSCALSTLAMSNEITMEVGCNIPVITDIQVTQPTCSHPFGSITIIATGDSDLEYSLTPSVDTSWQTSNIFSNLPGRKFRPAVRLIAHNECVFLSGNTGAISIDRPLVLTVSKIDASCFDKTDGSVTSIVNGGVKPYSYSWNTGAITNRLLQRAPGSYSVTVTDNQGCSRTNSVIVGPDSIQISVSQSGAAHPITATVTATGGSPGYTYNLGSGDFVNSNEFTNLHPRVYSFRVKDSNGCLATKRLVLGGVAPLDDQATEERNFEATKVALTLFPNPTNRVLNIQLVDAEKLVTGNLTILNAFGQEVMNREIAMEENGASVQVDYLPQGTYRLVFRKDDGTIAAEHFVILKD